MRSLVMTSSGVPTSQLPVSTIRSTISSCGPSTGMCRPSTPPWYSRMNAALPCRTASIAPLPQTLGHVDRHDQAPLGAIHRLAVLGRGLLGDPPLGLQVDGAADPLVG